MDWRSVYPTLTSSSLPTIFPEKRQPQDGTEKHLLRSAFANTGLLPDEIPWRPKEGFSDGVSSKTKSRFKLLQEHFEDKVRLRSVCREYIVY